MAGIRVVKCTMTDCPFLIAVALPDDVDLCDFEEADLIKLDHSALRAHFYMHHLDVVAKHERIMREQTGKDNPTQAELIEAGRHQVRVLSHCRRDADPDQFVELQTGLPDLIRQMEAGVASWTDVETFIYGVMGFDWDPNAGEDLDDGGRLFGDG